MDTIFECKAGELLNAIQSVAGVIDPKASILVYRNILIEASADGSQKLTAAGAGVQLSTTARLGSKVDASITINPQAVTQYLKTYPADQNVKVNLGSDGKVVVQAGRNRSSQRALPAQDFMPMTAIGELGAPVKITSGVLRKLLAQTVFCAPVDDTRAYLNGVCLEIDGDTINAVATDGHRLALSSASVPEMSASKATVTLPAGVAQAILKILTEDAKGKSAPNESSAAVTLQLAPTQAVISFGNFTLRTQLLEGKFPEWRKVVPEGNDVVAEMLASELESCLDGANVLRDKGVYAVTFTLNDGSEVRLSAKNKEQETYESTVAAQCHGGAFIANINPKYMKDVMALFGKDDVCVMACPGEASKNEAVVLSRKTADGVDAFKYVVMPMNI